MEKRILTLFSWAFISLLFLAACNNDDEDATPDPNEPAYAIEAGTTAQTDAVLAFTNVEDGEIIEFGEGTFEINQALIMSNKNDIIIRGQGSDKTILNFAGQTEGGESIKISDGTSVTLCGFTVRNGVSDAIKTQSIDGIKFYDINTTWEGDVLENNGNYGIYPVLCNNVEIDACYARGSADAGIYVGQSTNIIVKNSTVEENVAGIEIENCIGADVFGCTMKNNSGGILVYDLGNITSIRNGSKCRIFDNTINNNNHKNYSPNPNSLIGTLPVGTGIILLATDEVEIFNNAITSNNIASIALASYEFTGDEYDPSTGYDPRLRNVNIHDNTITRDADFPAEPNPAAQQIQTILSFFGPYYPEIVYDGIPGLGTVEDQKFRIIDNGTIGMVSFNLQADPSGFSPAPMDPTVFEDSEAAVIPEITLSNIIDCTK